MPLLDEPCAEFLLGAKGVSGLLLKVSLDRMYRFFVVLAARGKMVSRVVVAE